MPRLTEMQRLTELDELGIGFGEPERKGKREDPAPERVAGRVLIGGMLAAALFWGGVIGAWLAR